MSFDTTNLRHKKTKSQKKVQKFYPLRQKKCVDVRLSTHFLSWEEAFVAYGYVNVFVAVSADQ